MPGLLVKLFDSRGNLLAETLTNDRGSYSLYFKAQNRSSRLMRITMAFGHVQVFGKRGETVSRSGRISLNRTSPLILRAEISAKIEPYARNLSVQTDSFVDKNFLINLAQSLSSIAPVNTASHLSLLQTAACPLPPIFREPDLMNDVWNTLNLNKEAGYKLKSTIFGMLHRVSQNPRSFEQLNQVSGHISKIMRLNTSMRFHSPHDMGDAIAKYADKSVFIPKSSPAILHRFLDQQEKGVRKNEVVDQGQGLGITEDNLFALYNAALMTAKDNTEGALLLLGIKAGFKGVDRMPEIHKAALEANNNGSTLPLHMLMGQSQGMCGPDDGPYRGPVIQKPDIIGFDFIPMFTDWELEILECLAKGMPLVPVITDAPLVRLLINEISPNQACPGQNINISGQGFNNSSKVLFTNGTNGTVEGQILSRTPTNLFVKVPSLATEGPVWVQNPGNGFYRCNWFIPNSINSNSVNLAGGRTVVERFDISINEQNISYAEPGEQVKVSWRVYPENSEVKLTVLNFNGAILFSGNNLPSSGSHTLSIPDNINVERTLRFELEVTGICGKVTKEIRLPVTIKPTLTIEAVEVTQGIQNFSIAENGPNDVPLISRKGTIIRVFVSVDRNGFNFDQIHVGGKVKIGNWNLIPINGAANTQDLSGANASILAVHKDSLERRFTDHSLNFYVPAGLSFGTRSAEITLWTDERYPYEVKTEKTISINWQGEKRLKLRWSRWRLTQHGNNLLTDDEAEYNFERAIDLLPSSMGDVNHAPIWAFFTHLDMSDSAGRSELLNRMENRRVSLVNDHNMSNSALFSAVLNGPITFVNSNGNTVSANGLARLNGKVSWNELHRDSVGENSNLRVTTAHELGHNLGLKHVKLPTSGNVPSNTESHPNDGYLDNIPFDIFYNTVVTASGCTGNQCVGDFMSYLRPRRTSITQWERIRDLL